MMRRAKPGFIVTLLIGSVLLAVASLFIGTESPSVSQAFRDWMDGKGVYESAHLSVFVQQRLPRTLLALIAGGGLALTGCAFQALLRNPLATPYTLGIASFGALGAWTATIVIQYATMLLSGADRGFAGDVILWLVQADVLGFSLVQFFAFLFAGVDVLLIYIIATQRTHISPSVLLLAGVTLGMLANAGIMLMRFLAHPTLLVNMERWLMGGVDLPGYEPVVALIVGVLPCSVILILQASKFDQLGFGAEMAAGRGVNVKRLQVVTFLFGSLLTAIIVSKVGPIGFAGLIVPHAVRSVTGSRHRLLMPLCVIAGGGFLCFCDILARKLLTGETPIGIVTALFGGPFFLYLLVRGRFTDWDT
ncbi:MAG: ABC transporter permease [Candidatus Hydrogenedentota bacterium]